MRRIRRGAGDAHQVLEPGIIIGQFQLHCVFRGAIAVVEPVVGLKLDPRRGQQIERRGRDKLITG
jgi:hypothetical protein